MHGTKPMYSRKDREQLFDRALRNKVAKPIASKLLHCKGASTPHVTSGALGFGRLQHKVLNLPCVGHFVLITWAACNHYSQSLIIT